MANPVALSGTFKRGSSVTIGLTRKAGDVAVDMTGLDTRAMFRSGSVNGVVLFTLDDDDGIVIDDPTTGYMSLEVSRENSALMTAGTKIYFDVEQTNPSDPTYEWQSLTYYFKPDEQVTRDD